MAKEVEPSIEDLTQKLNTVIKKQQISDELRSSVIKLQEDLVSELVEQLNTEKERGLTAFKVGMFGGLVLGTIICIIINLIISVIL